MDSKGLPKAALICTRVSDMDIAPEDATQTQCEVCDVAVWIPNGAIGLREKTNALVLCKHCGLVFVENLEEYMRVQRLVAPSRN